MAIEQQFNQEDENGQGQNPVQSSVVGQTSFTGPGNSSAQPATQKQGSGRFTNLQKYISANQGAGDRLGAGLNQQVQKGFEPDRKEATTQAEQVRQGIQAGQQSLQKGQNLSSQFGTQGFDPTAFASNQQNLSDVARYRQGMGVDENALNQQQNTFDMSQQKAMENVQQRLGQVGSEEGRFGLLKETYGGGTLAPQRYTTGQQRLDQLFLQASPGNQIQNLQQGIQSRQREVQGTQDQAKQFGTQIGDLTTQESQLGKQLGQQVTGASSAEQQRLEGAINPYNQKRQGELDYAKQQMTALTDSDPNTVVDQNWLNTQGLQNGQRTYGAINSGLTLDQVADLNGQMAQQGLAGIGQTAGQSDIDRLNAYMRIAGGSINPEGNYQDIGNQVTKNSLGDAVTYKTGKDSIGGRVSDAENTFQQALMGESPVSGYGEWGLNNDRAAAGQQQNLKDYLYGGGDTAGNHYWNSSNGAGVGFDLNSTTAGMLNPALAPFFNGSGGAPMENYQLAEHNAHQNLIKNREDALRRLYYDQVLGSGGIESGNFNPSQAPGNFNVK